MVRRRKRVPQVFFAYPSTPANLVETIKEAVGEINSSRKVKVQIWERVVQPGKMLITPIEKSIKRAQIFTCDVTYPNFNVLYELGFAVGQGKRLWVCKDATVDLGNRIESAPLKALVPLTYSEYRNYEDLANAFLQDEPWNDLEASLLGKPFMSRRVPSVTPSLFHLKVPEETTSSLHLTRAIDESYFGEYHIIDYPKDNPSGTLIGYAEKVRDADAIIAHLLSDNQRGAKYHNMKCSFVCGIARGMGRPVLMLAHDPFECPLDYYDLLHTHQTAEECVIAVQRWFEETRGLVPIRRRARTLVTRRDRGTPALTDLFIGDHVAEHETSSLDDYFVETSSYLEALRHDRSIFVGRRGAGKTANFYTLAKSLDSHKNNHICAIKPRGYDIDGLIRVLEQGLHRAEQKYFVESLWKFLLYTELASSVVEDIESRPAHMPVSPGERRLSEFMGFRSELFHVSFVDRLEGVARQFAGLAALPSAAEQRVRISELLHRDVLGELRRLLGDALGDRDKVAILIDNLEEPWDLRDSVVPMSKLLLGLFKVVGDICDDFGTTKPGRQSVNLALILFLRSDIFSHMTIADPERDKLPIRRLSWRDPDMIMRVLDERMLEAIGRGGEADTIWNTLFPEFADGKPARQFIADTVLPRPRDAIFMLRECISEAINKGNKVVRDVDLYAARQQYSVFALRSILVEDDPRRKNLGAILVQFSQTNAEMRRSEILSLLEDADIPEDDIDFYMNFLVELGFLGVVTPLGVSYARDESEAELLISLARSAASRRDPYEELYSVNQAFHEALRIA